MNRKIITFLIAKNRYYKQTKKAWERISDIINVVMIFWLVNDDESLKYQRMFSSKIVRLSTFLFLVAFFH